MKLLDDQMLDSLLREAGDSFELPPSGAADVVARLQRDDGESAAPGAMVADLDPLPRRATPAAREVVRAHRVMTVAAAVVLLAIVAGAALVFGTSTPKAKTFGSAVARTPSTTAPVQAPAATGRGSVNSVGAGATSAGNAKSSNAAVAQPSSSSTGSSTGADQPTTATLPTAVGQPARIQQTGSLDLAVTKGALSATVTKLTTLATTYGGFVANSQSDSSTSTAQGPSASVTLQIPVANFSAVLKEAETFGKVSQVTTKATDVTAQYVDLQQRIAAAEASRQQYLTIMTKAYSVGDVLAVQAQLDTLQSQIEQLQGQLQVLSSETDYSTLVSQLSEPGSSPPHHHKAVALTGLPKAWHDSVHGFVDGVEGLVRVAGPVLFALLCLAALLLGGQLSWRRLQRHNL
jgi:hypothetical protein